MDLFDYKIKNDIKKNAPLAERMRPERMEEFFGHQDILGPGKPLRRLIAADRLPSMIFYGPPGSGKTSLAYVIAKTSKRDFIKLSAVTSGVKELRGVIEQAKDNITFENIRTIIFIDEIHRFNKAQQDALLPHVEDGTITLIGATTENPFFEVNKALLSRCQVLELKRLKMDELSKVLNRALTDEEKGLGDFDIEVEDDAKESLLMLAGGDARVLLNTLEIAVLSTKASIVNDKTHYYISKKDIEESARKKLISYDKGAEEHYNNISAFIKSIRGSDPDAAVYYLARMLKGGEDPLFIARRMVILASEDVGNACPMGLVLAQSCLDAVSKIGMPEARIILSQTAIFLAGSPKSNSSYIAIDRALSYLDKHTDDEIPAHIKDSHYSGASELGRGLGYLYPHDYPNAMVLQKYLPDGIMKGTFYQSNDHGEEKNIKNYLMEVDKLERGGRDVNKGTLS